MPRTEGSVPAAISWSPPPRWHRLDLSRIFSLHLCASLCSDISLYSTFKLLAVNLFPVESAHNLHVLMNYFPCKPYGIRFQLTKHIVKTRGPPVILWIFNTCNLFSCHCPVCLCLLMFKCSIASHRLASIFSTAFINVTGFDFLAMSWIIHPNLHKCRWSTLVPFY